MKVLTRLFVFWLLLAGAFWFWGKPYLLAFLSAKTRTEQSAMCVQQMRDQNIVPTSMPETAAVEFCQCMAEPLVFSWDDVMHMRETNELPPELEASMQAQAPKCQPIMDKAIQVQLDHYQNPGALQPAVVVPVEKKNADGSVEIRL